MAAAPWYRLGTVNVVNGSTAVVGVQTTWLTAVAPLNAGDVFLGPDGKLYEVDAITTDTALVLKTPYQGANANGQAYAVIHNYTNTLPADLYAKLAETLQQYHLSWDEFCTWATATGNTTFTNIAGGVITLPGLVALTNALNGRTVKNITGGATVTLTAAEAQARLLDVTGSGNNTLKVPAQSGMWAVSNLGSGTLTVLTAAGGSTGVTIAAGKRRIVLADGTNVSYAEVRGAMADQDSAFTLGQLSYDTIGDANLINATGAYYSSSGATFNRPSAAAGPVLHIQGAAGWQLYGRDGNFKFRGYTGTTFTEWRDVFHSGNSSPYNPGAVAITGGTAGLSSMAIGGVANSGGVLALRQSGEGQNTGLYIERPAGAGNSFKISLDATDKANFYRGSSVAMGLTASGSLNVVEGISAENGSVSTAGNAGVGGFLIRNAAAVLRWIIRHEDSETGSDAGSNLVISSRTDAGGAKNTHLKFFRATGNTRSGSGSDNLTDLWQVAGSQSCTGPLKLGSYTLATLPSAAAYNGYLIDVSNAAGGPKLCRSNGSAWQILNTTTTVS